MGKDWGGDGETLRSHANDIKINNENGREMKSFQCNCYALLEDAYLNGEANLIMCKLV